MQDVTKTRDLYEAGLLSWVELQADLAAAGLTERRGNATGWTFSSKDKRHAIGVRRNK